MTRLDRRAHRQTRRLPWHAGLVATLGRLARRVATGSILVAFVVASAACQASENGVTDPSRPPQTSSAPTAQSTPDSSEAMTEAEALSRRQEHLTEQAAGAGVDVASLPALVRWTSPQDYGAAMATCLTEAGFPATAETGGASLELPAAQQKAFWQAQVECDAKYTQHPYYTDVRPSPAALAAVYEWTKSTIACLAAHGQPVPEPPSLEVFTARYFGSDPVLPWSEVEKQEGQSRTDLKALEGRCPRTPDMTKYLEHNPVPVQ